jgi:NAD+ diphosphatase
VREYPERPIVGVGAVVIDGDRVLLVRRANEPLKGEWSIPGGAVEAGETLQAAVAREVLEETGVHVSSARYVASQPWPFPASLMLGFHAAGDGGEPHASDGELEEVHWLDRDAISEAAAGGDPGFQLPPPVSIARFLIDRWLAR